MKRKYEGLIVLNTRGKDDTVDTMVSKLGRDLEGEGVSLQQIDHVGKKKFPYGSKKLDEGYYVNYLFEAEPQVIDKLRTKLRLNPDVHQQHYQIRK